MEIILEIGKLVAVGLIAGFISSYLANRDHRYRKWWELRVAAYQSTIEALSDLVYYFDIQLKGMAEGPPHDKEFEERLNAYWDTAFPKVRKSADTGAFLFSEEVNRALKNFVSIDVDSAETVATYFHRELTAATHCLDTLVECSKKDLELRPSFTERIF